MLQHFPCPFYDRRLSGNVAGLDGFEVSPRNAILCDVLVCPSVRQDKSSLFVYYRMSLFHVVGLFWLVLGVQEVSGILHCLVSGHFLRFE